MDPVNTSLEDGLHQQQLFNSQQDAVDFNVVTQIKQTVLSNGNFNDNVSMEEEEEEGSNGKIEGNNVNVSKVREPPRHRLGSSIYLLLFECLMYFEIIIIVGSGN